MRSVRERVAVGVSAITAAALIGALHLHVDAIRGPDYFRWPSMPLPDASLLVLLGPALLVAWAVWRGRADARSGLAFFAAAATQALVLGWLRGDGPPLAHAADLLENAMIHGYLETAREVCPSADWMATYPSVMADQGVHVRVHPPGPVASYCVLFAITGSGRGAAVAAALVLGGVAASTPVFVQSLAARLGLGPRVALLAAALAALSPAPGAFFPSFDAVYPALVCGLMIVWLRALEGEGTHNGLPSHGWPSHGWAVAAGALGWGLSMGSYVLAVVVVPLAVLTSMRGLDRRRIALTVAVSASTFVAIYLALWLALGLDPFAVFARALENQADNLSTWFPTRAWPRTIGWDLWDFALGLPAIVLIPALLFCQRAVTSNDRALLTIAALGLALPTLAALSGQITTETFRTWMFMAPAVHLCAASELARCRPSSSAAFLACTALLSASVVQQVGFVWS